MPISREEFEAQSVDLSLHIFRLLKDNADLAFTAEEIRQMLIQIGRAVGLQEVIEGLEELVQKGEAKRAEISGQRWYTVLKRPMGFLGR